MGREKENEKKFNAYLDRILAGEEIKTDPAMDKELHEALDFTREMAERRVEPSAQFQARLKASLLQKLDAQVAQKKESRGSFWNVFRGHPVWQGAAAALVVIILLSIVWRAGFFQTSLPSNVPGTTAPAGTVPPATTKAAIAATTAAPAPALPRVVSIDAKTDKSTYQSGEMVKIQLSMRNITSGQLIVKDFPPILSIMQENTMQPVYTFAAGESTQTLAPDAAATFTYTWDQVDFQGKAVTGSYYIELEDLEFNGSPIRLNLNNPVRFEIMSKTVY
jgi:hypothetical protein